MRIIQFSAAVPSEVLDTDTVRARLEQHLAATHAECTISLLVFRESQGSLPRSWVSPDGRRRETEHPLLDELNELVTQMLCEAPLAQRDARLPLPVATAA